MRKLLAALLTISLNAYAIPPVSVDSEVTAVGNYVQNVKLPNEQATQLTSRNTRVETGNTNLLKNPSFEHMTTGLGWTVTNATSAADTANVVEGKKSLKLTLSGALAATQDSSINAANLVGLQGVASIKIKSSNVSGLKVCARNAGVTSTSLCVNVTADGTWKHISIPFIMTATSNGIAITSTGTSGIVYIDDAFVGTSAPLQGVSGAKLVGTVTITGCAANWTTTSTTFASFSTQTGCVYATTGQAQAPSTNIPAIKFSSLPAGDYRLEYEGKVYNTAANNGAIYFQFSDGTNVAKETSAIAIASAFNGTNGISQSISYSTNQSNVTLEIKSRQGGGLTSNLTGTTVEPGTIKVWYFPPESKIYSQASPNFNDVAYTPTITGFGAVSNSAFTYSRSGQDLIVKGTFTQGTIAASLASITLPSGLLIDTTKISLSNTSSNPGVIVGNYGNNISGGTGYIVTATGTSNSTVYFGIGFSNATSLTPANATAVGSSSAVMSVSFRVPIQGWQDYGVIVGSFAGIEKCANDYECTDTFSAKVTSAGVVSDENLDWINGNCSLVSSVFTCTLNTNLKDGSSGLSSPMNCEADTVTGSILMASILSSSTTAVAVSTYNTSGGAAAAFNLKCQKAGQDFKPKTAKVASSVGVPTVPGVTTQAIDTFSFSFGGSAFTNNCTASPCWVDQLGQTAGTSPQAGAIYSVTRSGLGVYVVTFNKTYTKFKCTGGFTSLGIATNSLLASPIRSESSNATTFYMFDRNGNAQDAHGTVICQGSY